MLQNNYFQPQDWADKNKKVVYSFQQAAKMNVETFQRCVSLQMKPKTNPADFVKANLICYKILNDAARATANTMLYAQMSVLNLDGFIKSVKEVKTSFDSKIQEHQEKIEQGLVLKEQGEGIKVPTSTAASFANVLNSMVRKLTMAELELFVGYLESLAIYMKQLENATVFEDFIGAQTVMLSHLQDELNDSTLDSVQTLMSFRAGVHVLAENFVDGYGATVSDTDEKAIATAK